MNTCINLAFWKMQEFNVLKEFHNAKKLLQSLRPSFIAVFFWVALTKPILLEMTGWMNFFIVSGFFGVSDHLHESINEILVKLILSDQLVKNFWKLSYDRQLSVDSHTFGLRSMLRHSARNTFYYLEFIMKNLYNCYGSNPINCSL